MDVIDCQAGFGGANQFQSILGSVVVDAAKTGGAPESRNQFVVGGYQAQDKPDPSEPAVAAAVAVLLADALKKRNRDWLAADAAMAARNAKNLAATTKSNSATSRKVCVWHIGGSLIGGVVLTLALFLTGC